MVGARGEERRAYEETGAHRMGAAARACAAASWCKGGRLVFLNFGIDEKGRYLGHTGGVSMFDTFNALWRELGERGHDHRRRVCQHQLPAGLPHGRAVHGAAARSREPVYRGGLRLEHVESRHLVCPYAKAFEQHRDPERFAREYIPTLRSWSEPTFASGLSARARVRESATRILDEFYGRYERLVAKSPAGHGMDYIHIHIVCAQRVSRMSDAERGPRGPGARGAAPA